MKALRKLAEADGAQTSGSDLQLSGHAAEFAEGADTVVYSSAVPDDNPELIYAREHKLDIQSRAEFLGRTAKKYSLTVAVAGSHGKTTCTAMLGEIFAPYNATVHLGGEYGGECGHVGGKKYFITEACEYRRNFLYIVPRISVVLNVALDHTDYYRDIDDITDAFAVFSRSAPVRILNGDDEPSAPLRHGRFVTFGLGKNCDFRAENVTHGKGFTRFEVYRAYRKLGEVTLKVMGEHNVYNALAATAAALSAGLSFSDVKRGLENFTGAKRRLEFLGKAYGCDVCTDYAHHPCEIESTVRTLRDAGYERVAVVFEPHTYTRTLSLLDAFAAALNRADDIILAEIYPAREKPMQGISSQLLCRKLLDMGRRVRCYDTYCELNLAAARLLSEASVLAYCGAGSIECAARCLAAEFCTE